MHVDIRCNLLRHQGSDFRRKQLPLTQGHQRLSDLGGTILEQGVFQIEQVCTGIGEEALCTVSPDYHKPDQLFQLLIGMPLVQALDEIITHDHCQPTLYRVVEIEMLDRIVCVGDATPLELTLLKDKLEFWIVRIVLPVSCKGKTQHVHAMVCISCPCFLLEVVPCHRNEDEAAIDGGGSNRMHQMQMPQVYRIKTPSHHCSGYCLCHQAPPRSRSYPQDNRLPDPVPM
ncbi:hypothetical protein SDC9_154226 [bioreactor metagenome]|uniref:Uncharacterized protein n=1 Tax=bioreactor metagenome TaxID=1076179 RepID=A0A645F0K8_9ZZZZ